MTDIDETPGVSRWYEAMQERLDERGSGWGDESPSALQALHFLGLRMGLADDISFSDKMDTVRTLQDEPNPVTELWREFIAKASAVGTEHGETRAEVEAFGYRWFVEFKELTCIEGPGPDCSGPVRWHMSASGMTNSARCDGHQTRIWQRQDEINERYPYHQPTDFDPGYAGEAWGEEDY